jgi:hypothetical protein
MAWISDGGSPEMQQGLRDNVPRPVVAVMAGVFGRGYRKNVAPVWKA